MSDLGGSKQAVVFEEAERLGSELEKLGGAIYELKELLDPVMSGRFVHEEKDTPTHSEEPVVCRVADRFRGARYSVIEILNNVKDIISRLEI
jgi:hypothetical protein